MICLFEVEVCAEEERKMRKRETYIDRDLEARRTPNLSTIGDFNNGISVILLQWCWDNKKQVNVNLARNTLQLGKSEQWPRQ